MPMSTLTGNSNAGSPSSGPPSSDSGVSTASPSVGSLGPSLTRKLQRVLSLELEDEQLLSSLREVGEYFPETNSEQARRQLRSQIEFRSLELSEEFLESFTRVKKSLDTVEDDIAEIRSTCDMMAEQLEASRTTSGKLIAQSEQLQDDWDQTSQRLRISTALLERFKLSDEDAQTLRSHEIDGRFFDALERARMIHDDCKILLRTQQQRAGLDIMDVMSIHQQAAYDRLYRWVKEQVRSLTTEAPDIHPTLQRAMAALAARPSLLSFCVEEIESTRGKILLKAFTHAVQTGGVGGVPPPIDVHSHDPVRYIGDMLAWIHQTLASEEGEVVGTLLGVRRGRRQHGGAGKTNRVGATGLGSDAPTTKEMLAKITEPLVQPFKARFDRALQSRPNTIVTYKLHNLVDFYSRMFIDLVGQTSPLIRMLQTSKSAASLAFHDTLREAGATLLQAPPPPPSDLSAPSVVADSVAKLSQIIALFDASLTPPEERAGEFAPTLAAVLDPLLDACEASAVSLPQPEKSVYTLNCVSAIQNAVEKYDFASERSTQLQAHCDEVLDTLVREEAVGVLRKCGLGDKLEQMRGATNGVALSSVPGLDRESLSAAIRIFNATLTSELGVLVLPRVDQLLSLRLRAEARKRIAQVVVDSYRSLYDTVCAPINAYGNAQPLFRHTPDQVARIVAGDE